MISYRMTFQEYHYYTEVAHRIFNYMNGRVNSLNRNCELYTDMYDLVSDKSGYLDAPNRVIIFIGNIIEMWNGYIASDRISTICTTIAWVIAHELLHADQDLNLLRYAKDDNYRDEIERQVQKASYDWVKYHAAEIEQACGFKVVIEYLTTDNLDHSAVYKKNSIKNFYIQSIYNVVFRAVSTVPQLDKIFIDDSYMESIQINIDGNRVLIKNKGEYLEENIPEFCEIMYNYVGRYNRYSATLSSEEIKSKSGEKLCIINIFINNPLYDPMIFAD
ncbi:MAG: hypothetical protein NC548_54110 [Lachnospiraceae bacterium]|nr:hypothetical protein [Lachnospiraceae bacterium]